MAIDAVICYVEEDGADLRIELAPRIERDEALSLPGQNALTIKGYTWKPELQSRIWGSGLVEIVPGRWYRREGYNTLVEHRFDRHDCV
jgi:hypothetical protein